VIIQLVNVYYTSCNIGYQQITVIVVENTVESVETLHIYVD